MRKEPTDAEKKLWHLLRRRNVEGHRFRRQVPIAEYIVDLCVVSAGLAVEADGEQHYDEGAKRYDHKRTEALLRHGIKIIRFTDYDILTNPDGVRKAIYRALLPEPPPQTSPGVPEEGVRGASAGN